ncbi:MAG: hypothetical protein ACP5RI_03235, partial [Candidatus Micrarchaeia archaeon]
ITAIILLESFKYILHFYFHVRWITNNILGTIYYKLNNIIILLYPASSIFNKYQKDKIKYNSE